MSLRQKPQGGVQRTLHRGEGVTLALQAVRSVDELGVGRGEAAPRARQRGVRFLGSHHHD